MVNRLRLARSSHDPRRHRLYGRSSRHDPAAFHSREALHLSRQGKSLTAVPKARIDNGGKSERGDRGEQGGEHNGRHEGFLSDSLFMRMHRGKSCA
jgi:hypothetical protein